MNDTFAERLKVLIGNQSANAFAREVDIGESLMRKYLAGATPGIDKVAQIAKVKGVALDWLINGEGEMSTVELPQLPQRVQATELEAKSEFTLVPRLDVQASAGAGRVTIGEDPLEYLAFQSTWLRSRNINPAFARILTARGDSMEETIRDGDVLLVDTSVNRIRDNTIYVIVYGDMVLVKRVHGRLNGSLQLISDNPRYPAEEVSAGEIEQLHVAGRVMWFGRSI
ncbi:LexA family transcriptional regulator [Brucella pseudogrignonensis]|uniref:Peptidase S24-like family protein n=1 Tax=Brucella pseudogrignonensis TaxID=419475 RepID=A0A256GE45_9HYPH|nr:helix-turn-helix transcriptional regulator [Brucella pseudogrignonensis]MCR5939392.1 helix-turn-helix transcriptional regulator [Ochrobactrum sp. XJ1]OYR25383.1 peptidase S24-like family protein [Brucella pseudogrignonensis]